MYFSYLNLFNIKNVIDYYLNNGDDIVVGDKVYTEKSKEGELAKAVAEKSAVAVDYSADTQKVTEVVEEQQHLEEVAQEIPEEDFRVILNGRSIVLEPNANNTPHEFIELMALADIDLDNPPPSGNMITTVNGKTVGFMNILSYGDNVVIRWADK